MLRPVEVLDQPGARGRSGRSRLTCADSVTSGRTRRLAVLFVLALLCAVNAPIVISFAEEEIHDYVINTHGYKAKYGHWSILPVSSHFRIDAVHAALLYTGKVLIVAGSGNSQGNFNAGRFESVIWNPANNHFKLIHTPSDMFCGGHTFLPDGKLLIAGGTARYEVLASQVKRAAGVLVIHNEQPGAHAFTLPAGTRFRSSTGAIYVSTVAATVQPATKTVGAHGATVTPSVVETWIHAVRKGKEGVVNANTQFDVLGSHPVAARNLYGLSNAINLKQQDFWGNNKSYVFDPATETYQRVGNLNLARWYPSLVGLAHGDVLAVSGLDKFGQMIGGQTEIYTPSTKRWTLTPKLTRVFPTYPALFLMPSGNLFFSGSNAGYGSATVGRTPGIWNLKTNGFTDIPGLRNPTRHGDERKRAPAARAGAALHDHRRWRRRPVTRVDRADGDRQPARQAPALDSGAEPPPADPLPGGRDHAGQPA